MAYAVFDTPAILGIPGIKELAQAGSEMVPPLVIATAQLLQVLVDSSVNIALPSIQDERHRRAGVLSLLDAAAGEALQ